MWLVKKFRERGVLGTCSVAHFLHDGFSDGLFLLFPIWQAEFSLSLTQVGLLRGMYSTVVACTQITAGFLAERWGERILLVIGTMVAAFGFAFLGLAGGFATLAFCLAIAGAGAGVQHPLCSSLVANGYDKGGRRAALGIYNFAGDVGKFVFPGLAALAAASFHWSQVTTSFGGVGFLVAVGLLAALTLLGVGGRGNTLESGRMYKIGSAGWGIQNKRGFLALSIIGMIDMATRTAFLTFVPFLLTDMGASIQTVGMALSFVFAGGAAGKFVCGILAERFGIFRVVILTEMLTAGGIILLLSIPLIGCLVLLPFIGMALNGTSSVLYGTVAELVTAERRARTYALFYTLATIAGALSPLIYGIVSDAAGVSVTLAITSATLLTTIPLAWVLRSSLPRAA